MVDDLRRLGMTPRSPDGEAGPAVGSLESRRADSRPSAATPAGTGAPGRARGAARQRTASTTAAGGITALERTLQQRTGRTRGGRRQAPRGGRATGEGMERVADPAGGGSPLARRGLGALERQRIEGRGHPEDTPPGPCPGSRAHRGAPGLPHAAAPAPARSAAPDPVPDNPVTQAILREFQALSRDVRSNAEARHEPS